MYLLFHLRIPLKDNQNNKKKKEKEKEVSIKKE